jgi:hypothetical protein
MSSMSDFKRKLQSSVRDFFTKEYLVEIGEIAADMIRTRTRLGYGVDADGKPRKKLKKLSDSYKKFRSGKLAFFTDGSGVVHPYEPKTPKVHLSEYTTANKSNLTLSGDMLDSVTVKEVGKNKVFVGPTGKRNEQVAEWVTEQGRPFNNLSNIEVKRLEEIFRKEFEAFLQKEFNKL